MPIASDVKSGERVQIHRPELINLYGCLIGNESKIGAFVEIKKNVSPSATIVGPIIRVYRLPVQ